MLKDGTTPAPLRDRAGGDSDEHILIKGAAMAHFHIPHPHLERRKEFFEKHSKQARDFNSWLAVKITDIVGTMWCAYVFAGLALISLPVAIQSGVGSLVAWIAQTFLQLVLLSIIMVGQKVAAQKSDRQLEQTYFDAEALLQISDDMHKLLKQNTALTEQISQLVGRVEDVEEEIERDNAAEEEAKKTKGG